MTDLQILTIVISVAIGIAGPVSASIWSNARVADLSKRIDETNTKIDKMETSLKAHIDNAFEHMKLLLELHEAKHHKP